MGWLWREKRERKVRARRETSARPENTEEEAVREAAMWILCVG